MMKKETIRTLGTGTLVAVWLALAVFAWFGPEKELSEAERRPLAQMPELSGETVLSGSFMTDFESYTLDQFPLRDTFRQTKALFHYGLLRQGDNNGIYLADGYAAEMEYPLQTDSLSHALERLNYVNQTYLADTESSVYACIVPDKSYYLASGNGHLAMDYQALFDTMQAGMPYASFVDITDALSASDFYRTDTHWRQECLLEAAGKIARAMDIPLPQEEDYTVTTLERPFYGVYYGQAALPMQPEAMNILESDLLNECTVYNHETGKTAAVYDMDKLSAKDLYEVFLSGPVSLLTVENPNADTDRELIVFRDSFGSSLAPLLVQGYRTITLVDIRYLPSANVGKFLDFHGQDVLFLYSTLVLNNSQTIK